MNDISNKYNCNACNKGETQKPKMCHFLAYPVDASI